MSQPICYIDRITGKEEVEKIYGESFLRFLYESEGVLGLFANLLLPLTAKYPFASSLYGWLQRSSISRPEINRFIAAYQVDISEFLEPVDSFSSFNDFFIRKLKPESRPIVAGKEIAILPADGRYLVYPNIAKADGFWVKGKKFDLGSLLQDNELAKKYESGSMVLARLCPVDYHRFHFPSDCTAGMAKLIQGPLFSVNPIALKKRIEILSENKRVITSLTTKNFGTILFIEIGATNVGSIHQTYVADQQYAKGDEKGYFSFGGSSLILLFEPDQIQFDQDLIEASVKRIEIRCLMGQSLGYIPNMIKN